MVVVTDLKKVRDTKDKAIVRGKKPPEGLLGRARDFEYGGDLLKPNPLVARHRDENPDYQNFYADVTFPGDNALASRGKFDRLSVSNYSEIPGYYDQRQIFDWTDAYHDGARRGLIAFEDEVGPWSVEHLATQYAGEGDAKIDPNVTGIFPNKGPSPA